jgi:hypothetical protein
MVSSLPIPRLRSDADLMRVRRQLGWQAVEYDGRIRRGSGPLVGLLPGEFVPFTSDALAGFTLSTSSFLLTLLENYGFQFHHLTPHAIAIAQGQVHDYVHPPSALASGTIGGTTG